MVWIVSWHQESESNCRILRDSCCYKKGQLHRSACRLQPVCFPLYLTRSPTRATGCQRFCKAFWTYSKSCRQSDPNSRASLKPQRYLKSINNLTARTPVCRGCSSDGHVLSVAQPSKSLLLLPWRPSGSQLEFFLTFKYGKHASCVCVFLVNLSVRYKTPLWPLFGFSNVGLGGDSGLVWKESVYSHGCWLGLQQGLCALPESRSEHETLTGPWDIYAYQISGSLLLSAGNWIMAEQQCLNILG